jgi:cytosine/adenosine deaminase-related metal-dependent hydrolase
VEPRRRYLSRFAIGPAISDPARFLGIADSVGTIGPGMAADLVLLDADPLDDIGNTRRIAGIVLRGRWLDRAALDRLLESVERAEDRRVNDWSRRR